VYIDSRAWRPGPGGDDSEEPPRRRAFDLPWRAIGWTLLVVWLIAASLATSSGPLAAALAYAALLIAVWRGLGWLGRTTGGLRDHKQ